MQWEGRSLRYTLPPDLARYTKPVTSLTCLPLPFPVEPKDAFPLVAGTNPYAFWLDSARDESPMSRYSYLGAPHDGGALRYESAGLTQPRVSVLDGKGAMRRTLPGTIWQVLPRMLADAPAITGAENLPLDALPGGYVGFMGYEAHADFELTNFHHQHPYRQASTPDALWMPATHYLAYEHASGKAWLIGPDAWVQQTARQLAELGENTGAHTMQARAYVPAIPDFPLPDRDDYLAKVQESQREIFEGNSYEVCLTAETSTRVQPALDEADLLALYLAQREKNSAPYASFLRCDDFTVLSSSPEKFLSVTAGGQAESKPIKGTVPRGATSEEDAAASAWLAADPKTRAENLMIVDLLRNDLSLVSYPESVRVPVLMGVESYSTVHQLVSTITAQLRRGVTAVDATAACFPGGSMTGAPKASTMAIIDRLEGRARGVYSGALGYFGADGSAALSIVIRTLIAYRDGTLTLAAGGAIVADSDPVAEYDEMVTKLRAAVPRHADGVAGA